MNQLRIFWVPTVGLALTHEGRVSHSLEPTQLRITPYNNFAKARFTRFLIPPHLEHIFSQALPTATSAFTTPSPRKAKRSATHLITSPPKLIQTHLRLYRVAQSKLPRAASFRPTQPTATKSSPSLSRPTMNASSPREATDQYFCGTSHPAPPYGASAVAGLTGTPAG